MSRHSERLGPPIAFKFAEGNAGEFAGYASTFGGPPDAFGDVIAPGAFASTLSEHRSAGTAPAMLWAHDDSEPIGRWIDLHQDAKGLHVEGRLTLALPRAREARALMKDGALALSIGYRTRKSDRLDGTRLIKDLQLFEISPVAIPANPRARILSVKTAFDANEIRDARAFEEFLRDAGFSRAFAKSVTASGFKAASNAHDGSNELAKLIADSSNEIRKHMKG